MPAPAPVTREPFLLYRPFGVWVEVAFITYQFTSLSLVFVAASSLFAPPRAADGIRCTRGYSPLGLLHAVVPQTVCQSNLYGLLEKGSGPLRNCILGAQGVLAFVLLRRARNAGVSIEPQLPRFLGFVPDTQVGRLTEVSPQRVHGHAYHAPMMWWLEPAAWARLLCCAAYVFAALWQIWKYPRRAAGIPQAAECEGSILVGFYKGNTLCCGWGFVAFFLAIMMGQAAVVWWLDSIGLSLLQTEKHADLVLFGPEALRAR